MADAEVPGRAPSVCGQCGTQIAPALLACPSCQRLVHAEELKRFAVTAERAAQLGDPSAALAAWRQALDLLPTDATQHQVVSARIAVAHVQLVRRSLAQRKASVAHYLHLDPPLPDEKALVGASIYDAVVDGDRLIIRYFPVSKIIVRVEKV